MKSMRFSAQVMVAVSLFTVLGWGQGGNPPASTTKESGQTSGKGTTTAEDTDKGKSGLDAIIEQSHLALGEFVKGNPEPMKLVWSSHRDDVTLGNPFGPFAHGWTQVVATMERAASFYKDGVALGFETVSRYETPDLAYTVEIERYKASIGGKDAAVVALRCTSIFRRENGTWKLVHRHADPITTVRPPESVVAK